jgi:hypothetical protein
MNINLKLKQRREKINEILQHKRTKVIRKFKQVQREATENEINPDDVIRSKIEKYKNVEKMINNFDQKTGGQIPEENKVEEKPRQKQIKDKDTQNMNKKEFNQNQNKYNDKNKGKFNKDDTFLNKKQERKTKEEVDKEKLEKLNKRKSIYRKLHQKTPRGQPVMKYQVEHIFKKIKEKINKGLI